MTDPVVRFSRVSKSFGSTAVLREIDLVLPEGQFLGLAGLNGAGKTTLIKCLLDFCDLDTGDISIHGIACHKPQARSRLSFLPERFIPPYFLTGREFVGTMLRLAHRDYDESRIRAMFDDLDLDQAALDSPVRSYSKGMTQKLGLAGCFLSERDLYVLDEPMTGLDPSARARVKTILMRLRTEGRTLLLTSHSLADIEEICDHMLVLHRGRFAFCGTPRELRGEFGESTLENAFLKCIEVPVHG
ncbi:MAG: ABC transporter ATP-binding protein [Betaproteobacteria bacterium RIFCSPLOWO2_12_FULL_63_13]|nr:MAG: ABC transporter ATP-binding protein [Betaproteobacteria bacterium RIFCSPLOWO2_12_FULL_63_13]